MYIDIHRCTLDIYIRTYYKCRYIRCKIQYILTLVSGAARRRGETASPSKKACTVNSKKYLLNNKLKLFGDGNLEIRINWTILYM